VTRLVWDKRGSRTYETGVDRGVLFPFGKPGVVWNGLTSVTESPSGAEASPQYSDNRKYLNLLSAEEFGGTIEAFSAPKEFAVCDGSLSPARGISFGQQRRVPFNLSYRTLLGNDLVGNEYGYKLHLIYNAQVTPSEKAYATVSDSPEAISLSWEFTTTPVDNPFGMPSSHLVLNSTRIRGTLLKAIEDVLYGTNADPRMVTPYDIQEMILNQPVSLEIVMDPETGIAELVEGGVDLASGPSKGLYNAPIDSRLKPTPMAGFYTLEENS
jgi:hypothetical protein